MRKMIVFLSFFLLSVISFGQLVVGADSISHRTGRPNAEPPGYYDAAAGLNCAALKTALRDIITTGMTPQTYGALWTQYLISDIKPREVGPGSSANVIWDIYSDNPSGPDPYNFTPGPVASGGQQDNGTAVSGEGQLYNREHSVPQSWFGASASPSSIGPESDYFHIFPTDKEVNANRGNFIYGSVGTPSITSLNGGKLGPNNWPGLSGTAFEPINEYKGDLARAFLYFVTRYQSNMAGWQTLNPEGNKAFDGTTWPSVELPYLQLMLQWHNTDVVSQKEMDRNDAGYVFQGNRNPYIDHPEFVGQVWSPSCGLLLPADITFFTATYQQHNVLLHWNIDRADGLQGFDVERSLDGGRSFQLAGTVNWLNGVNDYSFKDNVSGFEGMVLYRLRVTDINLVYKYSRTVSVLLPSRANLFVVYPNPSSGKVKISFRVTNTTYWQVMLTDLSGRIVQSANWQPGQSIYNLPVEHLSNGVYVLQLKSAGESKRISIVIQQ
ncbi:MAG: endonuclease [Chitinophagaceae bacterium]|nr:endonuclease [Chitinophagaceae bacterium]